MAIGNTAADFREKHDKNDIIHRRVKAALKTLTKDRWLYEGDFVKLAKLAQVQWSQVADRYADFVVVAKGIGRGYQGQPRRVVCGSTRLAAKLREVAQA